MRIGKGSQYELRGHGSRLLGHLEPQDQVLLGAEDPFYVVKPFPGPDLDPVG